MTEEIMAPELDGTDEGKGRFASLVATLLKDRFHDEFVFDPIIVQRETDQSGCAYFHTYIIFEGDQKKLDPTWTVGLSSQLWTETIALGCPSVPIQSFVKKSEWTGSR